jgi:DNA anti-recombination protein RmuC
MDAIIEIIKEMDIGHLLVMAAMFWFFDKRMQKQFAKIDDRFAKIDDRFGQIEAKEIAIRIERLETKFFNFEIRLDKVERQLDSMVFQINSIDKRLFVVEAILQMKGCCAITDDRYLKKAE